MVSTRIGNNDEARLYLKDWIEPNNKGGIVSKEDIDWKKTIQIVTSEDDLMYISANDLFDLLSSIGRSTKTLKTMKITIKRLKNKIHKEYY